MLFFFGRAVRARWVWSVLVPWSLLAGPVQADADPVPSTSEAHDAAPDPSADLPAPADEAPPSLAEEAPDTSFIEAPPEVRPEGAADALPWWWSTVAPASTPTDEPAPRPRRRLDAGRLLGNAIVGDLVGAAAGGLVSLAIAGAVRCDGPESGWLSGYQCGAGFGFAVALGALYGATIGGPLGVLRAGGAWQAGGDAGLALGAGGVGIALGTLTGSLVAAGTDQPTLGVAIGGGVGVLVSTLGAVLLYDGSRPPREVEAAPGPISCAPMIAPTDGGMSFGLAGTF